MDSTKALAILNHAAGNSLIFARREEIETVSPQFEPIVTVLELSPADFTDVGMGNMYPGKSATNRISDAAGVSFLHNVGGTREVGSWATVKAVKQPGGFWQAVGEYKVIGSAQGQRLKPDGTPRLSSVREYEFNVVDRANEDFLKDLSKGSDAKYTSEVAALKHLFELKKFATQRASTGAELAVVRELVGLPTAFKKDQIGKPLVFSQIVENNRFKVEIVREIMKTPDGRQAVVNSLFGNTQALFGPQKAQAAITQAEVSERVVSPEPENQDATSAAPAGDDFELEAEGAGAGVMASEKDQIAAARQALEEYYILDNLLGEKSKTSLRAALDNPTTPLDGPLSLNFYLKQCKAIYDRQIAEGRRSA
jgi:hypothetical protein